MNNIFYTVFANIIWRYTHEINGTIVTWNWKIVWKHGPNMPFYVPMLRTKLYKNPFFSIMYQNVNKPQSKAVKNACGTKCLPFCMIIIIFFFWLTRCKYVRIELCHNGLKFVQADSTDRNENSEVYYFAKRYLCKDLWGYIEILRSYNYSQNIWD